MNGASVAGPTVATALFDDAQVKACGVGAPGCVATWNQTRIVPAAAMLAEDATLMLVVPEEVVPAKLMWPLVERPEAAVDWFAHAPSA